jgi:hypothetical protein
VVDIVTAIPPTKQEDLQILREDISGTGLIHDAAAMSQVLQPVMGASTPSILQHTAPAELPQTSFVILPMSSTPESQAIMSMPMSIPPVTEVDTKLLSGMLANSVPRLSMDENDRSSYYYMQNALSMYPYPSAIDQEIAQHYSY